MQAYCFKCRRKVDIKNPQAVTLKNRRPATQGVCPTCGAKIFRIGRGGPPNGPDSKIPKKNRY